MKLKNLKIGTQLKLGFAIMLCFVIIMGVRSYFQSNRIERQIDLLYNHPLKVQRALGELKSDILAIHRDMKDLSLTTIEKEIDVELDWIELSKAEAAEHINSLYSNYLGPSADIDSVKVAFIALISTCDEINQLRNTGQFSEIYNRTKTFGIVGHKVEILLGKLEKIDEFATNKSDELYRNSKDLRSSLNNEMIALLTAILVLTLLINYFLLRNIHRPFIEMIDTTRRFQEGDLSARNTNISKNEFGILSASFNSLAESIQVNIDLNKKEANLVGIMLSEEDAKIFFQSILQELCAYTGSQTAAAYLLSDDKSRYEHFESIGAGNEAKQSFSAIDSEGELGSCLSSRKVQHVSIISENTRFAFYTVNGKYIPSEIITIPIVGANEVIAVISLASVNKLEKDSVQLIEKILDTFSARIEGILAYRKIKEISEKLEQQNRELEVQKAALLSQSAKLMRQNIELESQKKQLSEANRLKTDFLSNMSHELRTPLNSVIALSGVLNKRLAKKIPDEEYSYLEVIERNGKNLLGLINNILDISRIEAGHEEIEITRFNVDILVEEIVNLLQPQAQEKNIELLQKESGSELLISSDAGKLSHILQNLVGNAIKFTEIGKVEVVTQQIDDHIAITVTDTGIGISEDQLPFIFDEFRQADSSTSRRFGGTGLGLSLARKYAGLLGGAISVKSAVNLGSVFTLTMPLLFLPENR